MFDIGWTEMLVIAVILIVVVGPKDLPKMLRTFGRSTAKLRSMANDFQKQFNEALKEAELDDVKKSVDTLRSLNPTHEIKKQLNPFEKAAADVRAGLDTLKPKPPEPASATATAAEPLKGGATAMPGEPAAATPAAPLPSSPPADLAAAQPAAKPAKPKAAKKPAGAATAAKPRASRAKKKTESSPT
ncbi:Sec-independent protein translocase protein TatB [Mesorhizobium sp. ZMM04-5]|uniref:Sec-independent protein translocase protein TatB n=1 Tax=Mesorhizobium marinum TaxID=3228790 RepID=A0ABV3QYY5_9HYPH